MEITLWDHLLVVVVSLALPIQTWLGYPGFVERVRTEGEPARIVGYRDTIAIWLTLSAALVTLWLVFGRSWADLGIRWTNPVRLAVAAVSGLVLLWITNRLITSLASRGPDAIADEIGDAHVLVPRTWRELRWYRVMSINAGITEELVYRGFLLWYLQQYVGLVWAAALAVLIFTVAHAYQGLANVPALAVASVCFVGLYLGSGSLWVPILMHAVLDIRQGDVLAPVLAASEPRALQARPG